MIGVGSPSVLVLCVHGVAKFPVVSLQIPLDLCGGGVLMKSVKSVITQGGGN